MLSLPFSVYPHFQIHRFPLWHRIAINVHRITVLGWCDLVYHIPLWCLNCSHSCMNTTHWNIGSQLDLSLTVWALSPQIIEISIRQVDYPIASSLVRHLENSSFLRLGLQSWHKPCFDILVQAFHHTCLSFCKLSTTRVGFSFITCVSLLSTRVCYQQLAYHQYL